MARADDELEGLEHAFQGRFGVVIVPGEDAFGGVAAGEKKHLRVLRIDRQQALVHIDKQAVRAESHGGIRGVLDRQPHHLQALFQGSAEDGFVRWHLGQQEQYLINTEMRHGGLGDRQMRQGDGIVGAAQDTQAGGGRPRCPLAEDDARLTRRVGVLRLWLASLEGVPQRSNPRHG